MNKADDNLDLNEETTQITNSEIIKNSTITENDTSVNKKGLNILGILLIITTIFLISAIIFIFKPNWNYILFGNLDIESITVSNYNIENNSANIILNLSNTLSNNEIRCYISSDTIISSDDKYISTSNNKCEFIAELKDYYIILENEKNRIINACKLSDYVNNSFYLKINSDKIYLALGAEKGIDISLVSIGKIQSNILWTSSNTDVVTVKDGKISAVNTGTTQIIASDIYGNSDSVDVVVTNLINNYVLNPNKPLLKGTIYSLEEANLLDEILYSRVNEAGYSTRASAVAAARFLTLEFQYSIPYFFENGRLNSSGTAYVDGEGRYYHKGLYLHKSKFKSIEASFVGPAIWGMPLMNFENAKGYVAGTRMPNGLDCSGFVSWALLNGRI